ncbi:hypothetical protein B0H13DRAFT_1869672 [Mycena leptocephala]|nr:hypothetical protein B0H13DRAFT_1869672 [Mycena leptocephala]
MSHQPSATQIRFNSSILGLNVVITTVDTISHALKTEPISNTVRSLLTSVQTVKRNKDDCTQMLDQIQELLYGIIHSHIAFSDTAGELSPSMLGDLRKLTETLHKIHTFVEAQQESSRIKQFFRQGEMNTLLKGCHVGLEEALKVFKAYPFDTGFSSNNSSNSLSSLPSEPKIFHGRESEVSAIIQTFSQKTPRVAILGAGGMGKTSLARAVLHHPEITTRYEQNRVFIACDTVANSTQLAALIGEHLGLKAGENIIPLIVHHFSTNSSLLVLDNLETIWEPRESRGDIEMFLASLADVEHLALIHFLITMRGAERPANIQWTRPFLQPLKSLTQDAARKMFIDITDQGHADEDINNVLLLTDNIPLAIDLMANMKRPQCSQGYDKGSNLGLSISLSLGSPRLASFPGSHHLLPVGLLAMLPDGLSDVDLVQSKLPIESILACKTALLCTALVITEQGCLKASMPIREYMLKMHPPLGHLIQCLFKHFRPLIKIGITSNSNPGVLARPTSNFTNIQNILERSLNDHDLDLADTILCISKLHSIPNADEMMAEAFENFTLFENPDVKCAFYSTAADYFRSRIINVNRQHQKQSQVLQVLAWVKWALGDYYTAQLHAYESQRLAKISGNLYLEALGVGPHGKCYKYFLLGNAEGAVWRAI